MSEVAEFQAKKIWELRRHNCLGEPYYPESRRGPEVHPDFIRYKDWFYCIFNVEGGKRIIRSPDGETWETVQLARAGQMFSITPWGDLMTVGTSHILDKKPDGTPYRQSHTRFTSNGVDWSINYVSPETYDSVFYTVTWHKNIAYSVAYSGKDETGSLYRSEDARNWELVAKDLFPEGRGGNEGDLAFDENGTVCCLLRGTFGTPVTMGVSRDPEYREWDWSVPEVDWYGDGRTQSADVAIRAPFGGPKFLRLKDGRLIACGRVLGPEEGAKPRSSSESRQPPAGGDKNDPLRRGEHAIVTLFVFDPAQMRLTRLIDFPGYTHYHGVVEHDGKLWVACGRCDSAWEVWLLRVDTPA